jgi:neurotransmitter:Na+ symporter, NSS family
VHPEPAPGNEPGTASDAAGAPDARPPAHEHWRTGAGFVLAMLGSAVGLGNIWRFSYLVGDNGGAAFLLVYLLTIVVVGLPLLLAEMAIGKAAQRSPHAAFATIAPGDRWAGIGWLSVATPFVTLSYYSVVTGWTLKYLAVFTLSGVDAGATAGRFAEFISRPLEPLAWHLLAMAIAAVIVVRGVRQGIERWNRVLMPGLLLLMLVLVVYSASLSGARAGYSFLLRPDWQQLADPRLYVAALGQAFFSIGLAMGAIITYGSYLPRGARLPGSAAKIAIGDTGIALLAGLVIFPAVFTLGVSPTEGPTLAFVTLPQLFAQMPGGRFVGIAFFALLAIAAITSAVSILEVPVAAPMQSRGTTRRRAAPAVAAAAFVLGIPAALGYGALADLRVPAGAGDGLPMLDAFDALVSNLLLPLNGLAIALFVGWRWRRADAITAAGLGPRAGRAWHETIRFVLPVLIAIVLLGALGVF